MVHWREHFARSPSPESDGQKEKKQELHPQQQGSADALRGIVAHSGQPGAATTGAGILGGADQAVKKGKHGWLSKFVPELEEYAAEEDLGNYTVINRQTGEKAWEPMPIYVRVGMSLLFTGHGDELLGYSYINKLLYKQSVKQGKTFDQEEGALEHIQSFVKTYELESSLSQLAEPDLKAYKTFNKFFARQLRPDARPAANPQDPSVVVSAADCRLTVFEDVTTATQIWIKGREFTIPHLLHDDNIAQNPAFASGFALAIFRLAPQDYHRWHSPMAGTIGPVKNVEGALFTVNPMAVRNPDVSVFSKNKRDIRILNVPNLKEGQDPIPIPVVAVGAMLVGSIAHTRAEGQTIAKGEELGYFAYGGSTVILVFPKDFIKFDDDLLASSKQALETVVKVGERIGMR